MMSLYPPSTGRILPIVRWPHSSLSTPCVEVPENLDQAALASLWFILQDMFATMYVAGGAGLAANQVGFRQRVFVMDVMGAAKTASSEAKIFVNPYVVSFGGPRVLLEEACLSLPGVSEQVESYAKIVVRYETVSSSGTRETKTETFVDLEAQCIQHEINHLNGYVFADDYGIAKRMLTISKIKKAAK